MLKQCEQCYREFDPRGMRLHKEKCMGLRANGFANTWQFGVPTFGTIIYYFCQLLLLFLIAFGAYTLFSPVYSVVATVWHYISTTYGGVLKII